MSDDVNILRRKAREWAQVVVNLHNTQVPPEFEDEKRALLNMAKKIKTYIEKATGTIPELDPMNQLGALPVVFGVVGVAAAAAAVTKWTYDYKKFVKKISDRNALIKDGVDPQTAANIVAQADTSPLFDTIKSTFSDTKNLAMLGVAGLGLWYLINNRR